MAPEKVPECAPTGRMLNRTVASLLGCRACITPRAPVGTPCIRADGVEDLSFTLSPYANSAVDRLDLVGAGAIVECVGCTVSEDRRYRSAVVHTGSD